MGNLKRATPRRGRNRGCGWYAPHLGCVRWVLCAWG